MAERDNGAAARDLERALARTGVRLNLWQAEWLLLAGAAALLGSLFVVAGADLFLGFGRLLRFAVWFALLAVLAATAFAVVRALVRRRTMEGIAARIEQAFPDLDNRLINWVQLSREPDPGALARAYVSQGVPQWVGLRLREMRDRRAFRAAYAALAGAVLLSVAPFLLLDRAWPVAVSRVINPFSDLPPVTLTEIVSVQPGNASVQQGKSVNLVCKVRGRPGHKVWVDARPADGREASVCLGRLRGGGIAEFSHELPAVNADTRYRFRAGDCRHPPWYNLAVRPALAFAKLQFVVTPPEYTRLQPRTFDALNEAVEIPEGSDVAVLAACNVALESLTVVTRSGTGVPLGPGGDVRERRGPLATNVQDVVRVVAVNLHGDTAEAAVRTLSMTDRPPAIQVTAPKGRGALLPGERPAIEFSVSDDHGLTHVRLEQAPPENAGDAPGEERVQWPAGGRRTFGQACRPDVAAQAGRTMVFRVVAEDNCPYSPHRVRSEPIVFDVQAADRSAAKDADRAAATALLDRIVSLQKANLSFTAALDRDLAAASAGQWSEAADRQKSVRDLTRDLLNDGGEALGGMTPVVVDLYREEMLEAVEKLKRIAPAVPADKTNLSHRAVVLEQTILRKLTAAGVAADKADYDRAANTLLALLGRLVKSESEILAATKSLADRAAAVERGLVERQDGLSGDVSDFVASCRREAAALDAGASNLAARVTVVADECEKAQVKPDMLRAAEQLEKNAPREALVFETRALATLSRLYKMMAEQQMAEAARRSEELVQALQDAGERLKKIEQLESRLVEAMRQVETQKDRSGEERDLLRDEMEELKENIRDALLEIPKDLHIYPELSVANELVEDIYTVFEEVTQLAGSERMTAEDAQEMGVLKPEDLLEMMKKAEGRMDDMEMWLAEKPDSIKFNSEAFDREEMPKMALGALATSLEDLIGDLLKESPGLAEAADDSGTNLGMSDPPPPGWEVAEGPIESFGAQGKSANQVPDHKEQSGRSLVGRQGQAIGETAAATGTINEGDKNIEKRITPEPLQSGQVQADGKADEVATGGGKQASGAADGQGMSGDGSQRRMDATAKGSQKGLESLASKTDSVYMKASLLNLRAGSLADAARHIRQAGEAAAAGLPIRQVREHERQALTALLDARTDLSGGVSAALGNAPRRKPLEDEVASAAENAPAAYRDLVSEYFRSLGESL